MDSSNSSQTFIVHLLDSIFADSKFEADDLPIKESKFFKELGESPPQETQEEAAIKLSGLVTKYGLQEHLPEIIYLYHLMRDDENTLKLEFRDHIALQELLKTMEDSPMLANGCNRSLGYDLIAGATQLRILRHFVDSVLESSSGGDDPASFRNRQRLQGWFLFYEPSSHMQSTRKKTRSNMIIQACLCDITGKVSNRSESGIDMHTDTHSLRKSSISLDISSDNEDLEKMLGYDGSIEISDHGYAMYNEIFGSSTEGSGLENGVCDDQQENWNQMVDSVAQSALLNEPETIKGGIAPNILPLCYETFPVSEELRRHMSPSSCSDSEQTVRLGVNEHIDEDDSNLKNELTPDTDCMSVSDPASVEGAEKVVHTDIMRIKRKQERRSCFPVGIWNSTNSADSDTVSVTSHIGSICSVFSEIIQHRFHGYTALNTEEMEFDDLGDSNSVYDSDDDSFDY
ncbi:hypothetical protein BZA70DRAFT_301344 [Myxozyma melibiosi]|uniref:Uncharacterized protein n=1 Tax=Myxozyma melibiosi TaxID=54550 RepID=A0ABR1FE23_9ASCO